MSWRRRSLLAAAGRSAVLGLASPGLCGLSTPVKSQATEGGAAPRLISLGGGMTECVYALGAEGLLVGTDTTSLFPAAAQRTPKVGYLRALSAEGVLSLRPTAVIGSTDAGPPAVIEQLRSAGVTIELVHSDHSFDEVRRKVRAAGAAAARVSAGRALEARLANEFNAATAAGARRARKPRVMFVMAHAGAPMVSGTGTAAHAMIEFAGGLNAVTGYSGYKPLTPESAPLAAPDWLLTTEQGIAASGGLEAFWQRPGLLLTPAAKERRLVVMDAVYLLGFGPRLPQAVADLALRLA